MTRVGVRAAGPGEAELLGQIQVRAWRAGYAGVLPPEVLDTLIEGEVVARWHDAVTRPPSERHVVLAAVEDGGVVGLVAFGPAEDPDLDPNHVAEVGVLLVDPAYTRRGHGSRLLAAATDRMRDAGFRVAVAWLPSVDDRMRAFLTGAGWAPDGAYRDLDLHGDGTTVVGQIRLSSDLGEPSEPSEQ